MKRREFIAGIGSVTAWPAVVRAQQRQVPLIGFLNIADSATHLIAAFQQGLGEQGYIDGQNVEVLFRYAPYDRLPALAEELVRRPVFRSIIAKSPSRTGLVLKIGPAFERMAQQQADALLVSSETLFISYNDEIATLAKRYKIPSMFVMGEAVEQGGLISYGVNAPDLWRQVGVYVGRILNGEKAAELPVQQPTRWAMVINLKTAKALDLTIPNTLLVRADEVIE
jgi:hypothetical protein